MFTSERIVRNGRNPTVCRAWDSVCYFSPINLVGCRSPRRALALFRPCLGLLPFVPTILSSILLTTPLTIILESAPSSCFTLAVPMRGVSCVGYTPITWDPRSLQSMLNGPLYLRSFATSSQRLKTALSLLYNDNNPCGLPYFDCVFRWCYVVGGKDCFKAPNVISLYYIAN